MGVHFWKLLCFYYRGSLNRSIRSLLNGWETDTNVHDTVPTVAVDSSSPVLGRRALSTIDFAWAVAVVNVWLFPTTRDPGHIR